MKLTEEQIENMEWEDMEKIIKDAIESRDMEFITSTLPYVDDYFNLDGDYFVSNFDHDLFKDRDMALLLAKLAQIMPKDLYENDEEMVLTTVSAPSGAYRGFYLASDELLHNKNFVMQMISNIYADSDELEEILSNLDEIPSEVLKDEEYKKFIKNIIQELREKKAQDKKQSKKTSKTPSELEQLASTKKELEQIVSELRENIASAQKLLASYEELLNGEKQNESNKGQTFGEE